ncbi:cob(I)yrinic acid a,c-diamide adenosyltransferase [Lacticigenium naphthae]|uniref:cob(I)yrinic acid a,c-diamide adenosyltransferase n=1 Tax=Lacticigenium naphthae TaxID=515351 RepID=UPI00041DD360|nr:cob(I)yrinic acid a,c-diamide adenosyltransferase [Lacticigenium naphthae]
MKWYTKRGDNGNTNVIGGRTVKKTDVLIEAIGSLDEVNAFLGDSIARLESDNEEIKVELIEIQHYLFDLGTDIADIRKKLDKKITDEEIEWLEKRIDMYSEKTPPIEAFILPGGHPAAASLHIVRTVTRRAERVIVRLHEEVELDSEVLIFINRLSDYLFVLSRYINFKMKVEEPIYERGGKVFHPDK